MTSLNIQHWDHISERCNFLKNMLKNMSENKSIDESHLKIVAHLASQFGEEGTKKFQHLCLDAEIELSQIGAVLSENENVPKKDHSLCESICGKGNLCSLAKAVNIDSPLDLPPRLEEKYSESGAVELFIDNYRNELLFHPFSSRFYRYENGVWKAMNKNILKMHIERFLVSVYDPDQIVNSKIENMFNRLMKQSKLFYEDDFNLNKFILNFQNGLYDLQSGKLLPHTPEYKSTVQFPVYYDPEAECNLFDKKITEILGSEEVIDHLLRWVMYTLIPTYEYQKCLLLLGKGGNGKSVIMNVWAALLGEENVSNKEFKDLATNQHYSVVHLMDKYANFSKELSSNEKETSIFKSLTGNDRISAREIHKPSVDFKNTARLIMAANQVPKFKELDYAVLRRFDIIKFEKRFDKVADTTLDRKLKRELSGILNRVLSKASEIIHEDGSVYFRSPRVIEENLEILRYQSDSIGEFISERTELSSPEDDPEFASNLGYLYDTYKTWCRNDANVEPKSRNTFKKTLESAFDRKTYQVNSVRADSGKVHKKMNWVIGIKPINADEKLTADATKIRETLGLSVESQDNFPERETFLN